MTSLTPTLTTKLHPPRVSRELVVRTRLLDRLDLGLDRALTLISAPAGFGKTTLVVQWLQRNDERGMMSDEAAHHSSFLVHRFRTAWLSLDGDDNDPARFLAHLGAAFQTVQSDLGRAALAAQEVLPPPAQPGQREANGPEQVLAGLINEITALLFLVVLILDDYHLIHAQPVHDAVTFLLEHQPANLHLVIATRADPPLAIARLRGRGQVNELRQDDLRFTADEAAEFLTQVTGLHLAPGDITALADRTEGWIAGLQMAAVSLQGREVSNIASFVQAFAGSNRFILDYLLEEVLQRQSEDVQTFLLQTSILDRLCGMLCDEVIGGAWAEQPGAQSQPILEYLERANLFVVPLDDHREWYRFHRLFSDLLRSRLEQATPELPPTLRRRASAWFERHGLAAEAIDHALAAQDFERAARLAEEVAEATLTRSELATFLRWMGRAAGRAGARTAGIRSV